MSTKFFTNEEQNTLLKKIEGIFKHKNIHFLDATYSGAYPPNFSYKKLA